MMCPSGETQVAAVAKDILALGGIAVCGIIARQGEIVYSFSFGHRDLESSKPAASDDIFMIGSQTKSFVAAGYLLLEKAGAIKLKDKIGKFLGKSEFPSLSRDITILDLLCHRSGIGDYSDYLLGFSEPNYFSWPFPRCNDSELIRFGEFRGRQFRPGESWAYNNTGYVLLGYLVSAITGQSATAYLTDNILEPLGLKNTYFGRNGRWPRGECLKGYLESGKRSEPGLYDVLGEADDLSFASSAGDIISNFGDLAKWGDALISPDEPLGLNLSCFTRDIIDTRVNSASWLTAPVYGIGLERLTLGGREFWGHNGATLGYRSGTFLEPLTRTVLSVVMTFVYRADEHIGYALHTKREQLLESLATTAISVGSVPGQ